MPNSVESHLFRFIKLLQFHKLRGTIDQLERSEYKRERIVNDIQPSHGYMHAGYPIVTHLDISKDEFDTEKLLKKSDIDCMKWGIFHGISNRLIKRM